MPPRKRARVSAASTPQPKTTTEPTSPETPAEKPSVLNDPWTDDEESQLFKSLIKFKPTGVHKHFRMIAIQHQLSSHGYVAPTLPHTKIPGIWEKLDSLYDLEVLDDRENAHIGLLPTSEASDEEEQAEEEDEEEDSENPWRKRDFDLPEEDQERAFNKRLDESRESSPEAIEGLSRTRNVLGAEELREKREEYDKEDTSSVKGRGRRGGAAAKGKRGRAARSTRSTPAETPAADEDEDGEEEGASTVADDSPQSKGNKKGTKGTSTRRTRRR